MRGGWLRSWICRPRGARCPSTTCWLRRSRGLPMNSPAEPMQQVSATKLYHKLPMHPACLPIVPSLKGTFLCFWMGWMKRLWAVKAAFKLKFAFPQKGATRKAPFPPFATTQTSKVRAVCWVFTERHFCLKLWHREGCCHIVLQTRLLGHTEDCVATQTFCSGESSNICLRRRCDGVKSMFEKCRFVIL